ncbi:LOW QUALITY PROTEIN: DUF4283 domain-containing protein, partial [Cephalotus follicularis]
EAMSDGEDDNSADPAHPKLKLSSEEKRLRTPWRKSLIIKLLGKSIGIKLMSDVVRRLWQPAGDFELLKLRHGYCHTPYLLAKFDDVHDCSRVLTGGSWLIFGHCPLVQPWKPNFKPASVVLSSIAVWVRLHELPLEFYDEYLLFSIRSLVGKPLHLDKFTALATRTKYARLCVEMEL